jgi:spectinomycin phosphotransferase
VLDDATVALHVRSGWDLPVTGVRYLAIGLDADARAYQALTAVGNRYFVKVRAVPAGPAAALVPRHLRRCGITAVVAPLDSIDGTPWLTTGDGHQLLVYPFVAGSNGWDTGLTDAQWLKYGEFLAALHATEVPPDLAAHLDAEQFDPPSLRRLAALAPRFEEAPGTPTQRELIPLWRTHERRIADLAARTAALRDRVRTKRPPHVLCHTDIHTGNVLVPADPAGRLSIVDWDAPLLAPRERDLMFVLGGPWSEHPVTPEQERLFRRAYGAVEVDRAVLDYYLSERVLDDIEQFMRRILSNDDDVDEETRRTDLYWLRRNLEEL